MTCELLDGPRALSPWPPVKILQRATPCRQSRTLRSRHGVAESAGQHERLAYCAVGMAKPVHRLGVSRDTPCDVLGKPLYLAVFSSEGMRHAPDTTDVAEKPRTHAVSNASSVLSGDERSWGGATWPGLGDGGARRGLPSVNANSWPDKVSAMGDETVSPAQLVARGRRSVTARGWREAYSSLLSADQVTALAGGDLELLATAAYMLGRDDEWIAALERAHYVYLDAGESLRGVRCAFWVGVTLATRGEMARATGWLSRAHRLLEREQHECVEQGYLLLPLMFEHEANGDHEAAAITAATAAEIGERFGDTDLFALAVHAQGDFAIRLGRVREGLALLDEAMVAVTTQAVSPVVAGLVYCGVIAGCRQVFELRRAQEWTAALTVWCERATGYEGVYRPLSCASCRDHAVAWCLAGRVEEARRAGVRLAEAINEAAAAQAFYRQGEVHRLWGTLTRPWTPTGTASRYGWEPQPGMALVRLAQGNTDAATAAIRRAVGERLSLCGGPVCFRRASRLCWPRGTSRRHASPAGNSPTSPTPTRATCSRRWPRTRAVLWSWPRATRRLP